MRNVGTSSGNEEQARLWLLLQKERIVFSLSSTSCHVIFATIFTPSIASQHTITRWSTPNRSAVSQPTTARHCSVFYEKYCTPVCTCVHIWMYTSVYIPAYLDVHQCVLVYLDVHQCVPVYLDVH